MFTKGTFVHRFIEIEETCSYAIKIVRDGLESIVNMMMKDVSSCLRNITMHFLLQSNLYKNPISIYSLLYIVLVLFAYLLNEILFLKDVL